MWTIILIQTLMMNFCSNEGFLHLTTNFNDLTTIISATNFLHQVQCWNPVTQVYTGCPRRNGQNFGRVFLMLKYTYITQNTYIQSWTVMEIMAIEKCELLGCPRTVRRLWRHIRTLRMPGNETPLANIIMQWPWRDYASAAACVNYLET